MQQCLATLTRYHDAYGIGLQLDDGVFNVVDPTKPVWTESTYVRHSC
jgi:nicastrin